MNCSYFYYTNGNIINFYSYNCIWDENLEGAFIEPKYIANKRGRQIVEEKIKTKQK